MAISTNGAILTRVTSALYGEYLSNASYTELKDTAPATAAANFLTNDFAGKTDLQVANTILTNLGLTSITGLNNWLSAQLTAAGSTAAAKGAALVSILNGYANMTTDATYGSYATSFNAKVEAGLVKSQTAGAAGGAYATADAVAITNGSFSLTTGLDTGSKFTGGAGDDTFVGVSNQDATIATLTTGDSLVGGAGSDTLTIAASGTIAAAPVISTSSIENLSINNNSTNAQYTVDATLMDGLKSVAVTAGANPTVVTNSGLVNLSIVGSNKDVTVTPLTAAVAGSADAASIALNGVARSANVGVTYNGVETLNISSSGSASGDQTNGNNFRLSITDDKLKTANIEGSVGVALTLTTSGATAVDAVGVIDASKATAGVDLAVTAGTSGLLSVTGGAGSDKVNLGAVTKYMTVVGGAGTDTLVVSSAAKATTGTQPGANVSGFEVLEIAAGGSASIAALAGNTFESVTAKGSATLSDVGAAALTINATPATATGTITTTRATNGTADALTVNLAPTTSGTFDGVSAVNEESITINSGGTATNTITTLTVADATSLTVTGSRGLVITTLTGETALKTIDASGNTGVALTIDASDSTAAMTVKGSGGNAASVTTTHNTITTGSGADTVTVGAWADVVTTNLGNDTITSAGGNDTITSGAGNDVITVASGDNSINGGLGDDSITAGAGNDKIDGGAGNNTIVAGDGNDLIAVTTLSDSTSIDGGAGSADRLASTTGTITTTDAASVNTAFISQAGDVTPTITGVETVYVSVNTTGGTQTTPVNLNLSKVTGTSTLNLEQTSADQTASGFKVTDFSGATINLYGATTGAAEDKFTTFDGTSQASLSLNLHDYDAPASATTTVTGVTALTVNGQSSSVFSGNADQQNSLVTLTATAVESATIKSSGSVAANLGAGETQTVVISANPVAATAAVLTVLGVAVSYTPGASKASAGAAAAAAVNGTASLEGRVTAVFDGTDTVTLYYAANEGNAAAAVDTTSDDTGGAWAQTVTDGVSASAVGALAVNTATLTNAQTITLTAAALDGVHVANVSAANNLAQTITINGGAASAIGLGRVDAGSAAVQTLRIDLADSAILSSNGASGAGTVDFDFTSAAVVDVDLAAGATAKIDLTGEVVTSSTWDVATSATLLLGDGATTALGVAGSASSFTFAGRGNVDFDNGINSTDIVSIAGTTVTFNASGLTVDTDAIAITSSATVRANITTGLGADSIVGGAGNDSLSGGAGADTITGGTGSDTLVGGLGSDVYKYITDTESALPATAATNATGFDSIVLGTGDTINFASATLMDGGNTTVSAGTTTVQTITLAAGAEATTTTLITALTAVAAIATADKISLVKVVDNTTDTTGDGGFSGYYLIVNDNTAAIAVGDVVIRLTGVSDTSTFGEAAEVVSFTL